MNLTGDFLRQQAVEMISHALGNQTWWNLHTVEVPTPTKAVVTMAVGPEPATAQRVILTVDARPEPGAGPEWCDICQRWVPSLTGGAGHEPAARPSPHGYNAPEPAPEPGAPPAPPGWDAGAAEAYSAGCTSDCSKGHTYWGGCKAPKPAPEPEQEPEPVRDGCNEQTGSTTWKVKPQRAGYPTVTYVTVDNEGLTVETDDPHYSGVVADTDTLREIHDALGAIIRWRAEPEVS